MSTRHTHRTVAPQIGALPMCSLSIWATLALLVAGCGTPDLEIRGVVSRTVGEKLELELVQGDAVFSGTAQLRDASNQVFESAKLKTARVGQRQISLRIPTGIAVGQARLEIGQEGGDSTYVVGLELSRLALVATDAALQTLPLPRSTIAPSQTALTGSGGLSLSPGGGLVAVVEGGTSVKLYEVGGTLEVAGAPYQATSPVVAVAALDGGALVATEDKLVVLKQGPTQIEEASFAISGVRGLAVDQAGARAVAVSACDTDNDTVADGDCLTVLELAGVASALGREVKLDDVPSAEHVAMRADGTAVVVPDDDVAYGLVLDDPASAPTPLRWPTPIDAVGIDRAPTKELGDIFAVADAANNEIQYVGFQGATLAPVKTAKLDAPPVALGFGRQTELFVAIGNGLSLVNVYQDPPVATAQGLTAAAPITALVVQR